MYIPIREPCDQTNSDMKKATYTVLFNRRNRLDKYGRAPIEIRITHDRQSKVVPTGIKVLPEEWNMKQRRVYKNNPHYIRYNKLIYDLLHELEAFELRKITEGKLYHIGLLDNRESKPKAASFTAFWELLMHEDRTLKLNTRKNHRTHLNHLKAFKETVAFHELTVRVTL